MKRFFTTVFIIAILALETFASINVYPPTLVAPANNAINQMPDVLLDWAPVTGSYGLFYRVQIDNDSSFSNPIAYTTTFTAISTSELLFNETYYWRVKAIDNTDSSNWSSARSFSVINEMTYKPMNVNIWQCYVAGDSIQFFPITGITYYEYQIDTILSFNSSFLIEDTISANKLSYVFPQSLYSNLTYYFRIRAKHNQSTSKWSIPKSFKLCNNMPGTPELHTPADLSTNLPVTKVIIKWMPVAGATSYIIEYAENANLTNAIVKTLPTINNNIYYENNSVDTISNLDYNTTYFWRVKAVKNYNNTAWSAVWQFTTTDAVPVLTSPLDLATEIMPSTELSWVATPDANKYIIEYSDDMLFSTSQSTTSATNNVTINNLKFGETYYWHVKFISGTDTSAWSVNRSFTVIDVPEQATPFNSSIGATLNELVSCQSITGANAYNFLIDTTNAFNSPILIDSVLSGAALNLFAGMYNTTYYWKVKAMHAADTSNWSSVWQFTTIDTMPALPVIVSPLDSATEVFVAAELKWTAVDGADNYLIEIDTNALFTASDTLIASTNTITTDVLMFDTYYSWRIKAAGTNDTTAWTATYTFKTIDIPTLISPADNAIDELTSVVLEWEAINGVSDYMIEIDTDNLFATSDTLTTVNNTLSLNNLLFGNTYFWRVKALSIADTTDWSQVFSFTVFNNINLIYPADSSITPLSTVLKWENITEVSKYECQIDTAINFNSTYFKSLIINSDLPLIQAFSTQDLFGTMYYWKVRAINGTDTTVWSSVFCFTTTTDVALVLPVDNSTGLMPNVSLMNLNIAGVQNYMVELDTTDTFDSFLYYFDYPTSNIPYVQSATDELLFGTKYYWRVRGRIGTIFSNWSDIWEFTTVDKVTLSQPLDNASILNTNPTFKWQNIDGVTGYIVELDTTPTFNSPSTYNVTTNELTVLSSELLSGKTYYWRVKAIHSKDESDWSIVWQFNYTYNVGIESNEQGETIAIYPNPAKNIFNININTNHSSDASLNIIDITGRIVYNESITLHKGNNNKPINVSSLTQGVYIISIKNDNINFNKKLILNN